MKGLSSDPWLGFDSRASKTSVTPTSPNVPEIQVSAEVLVKVSLLLSALGCEGVQACCQTSTFSDGQAREEASGRSREGHWFPMYSEQLVILVISYSKQFG